MKGKYSPAECIGAEKYRIEGDPDLAHVSTSYVERSNLTIRMEATIDHSDEAKFAWKIWHLDWPKPASGEHAVTSRAIDVSGQIQPAMDDPWIAKKKTYWESNGQVTRRIKIS